LTFTQMVSAEGLSRGNKQSQKMLLEGRGLSPWAVQIFGANPKSMAKSAKIAEEAGYQLIDINMGCPVPKVYKIGAGAALLEDVGRALELAEAVVSAVSVPVSAKLRLGPRKDYPSAFTIIPGLAELGLAFVTVHARYTNTGYFHSADWEALTLLKRNHPQVRLIGNGDVLTGKDGTSMIKMTGVDGIMVGRGMLGNPWIFSELRGEFSTSGEFFMPSTGEKAKLISEHFQLMVRALGEKKAIADFRKHFAWYLKAFPDASSLRHRAVKVKGGAEVEEILKEYVALAESREGK